MSRGPPFWVWLLVAFPLGAALIAGAVVLGKYLLERRFERERGHDQAAFLGSYAPPACVAPNACEVPRESKAPYLVDGVTYGVCRRPSAKNADESFDIGDYVFAEVTLEPTVVRIVGKPGTEYAVKYPSGIVQRVGKPIILGRICTM